MFSYQETKSQNLNPTLSIPKEQQLNYIIAQTISNSTLQQTLTTTPSGVAVLGPHIFYVRSGVQTSQTSFPPPLVSSFPQPPGPSLPPPKRRFGVGEGGQNKKKNQRKRP